MKLSPPGCTILILEPPPGQLDQLALSLSARGHHVLQTEAGDAAGRVLPAGLDSLGLPSGRVDLVIARLPGPPELRLDLLRFLHRMGRIACILAADPAILAPERVRMLDAGADDCLLPCMEEAEMVARIQAVLRRGAASGAGTGGPAAQAPQAAGGPFRMAGGWALAPQRRALLSPQGGQALRLTAAEFELLRLLLEAGGETVDRETISQAVFRRPWRVEDRAVDSLVKRVRQKVQMEIIATVRGQGYAIVLENVNSVSAA